MKNDEPTLPQSPLVPTKMSRRRLLVRRCTLILLVAIVGAYVAGFRPLPTIGGGEAESMAARAMKNQVYAGIPAVDEAGFSRLEPDNLGSWLASFKEPVVPLSVYQLTQPVRPSATRRTLVLQPLGDLSREELRDIEALRLYAAAFFQVPVRVEKPLALPVGAGWTRPSRLLHGQATQQYDAAKLLTFLSNRLPDDALAFLGVTMTDLWAGDLNYAFGLGGLSNRTGVHRLCRYYPEFWGRPRTSGDSLLGLKRACKVLNHETGHMLGLSHCVFYHCSMNGSNSLDEVDAAPCDYCPVCHRKLLWNTGCDGVKRYSDLIAFYRDHHMDTERRWTEERLRHWRNVAPDSRVAVDDKADG